MKLKEKLAKENTALVVMYVYSYDIREEDLDACYIAGFEAARDMAVNSLGDFDVGRHEYDVVGNLGEEEVE